MIMRTLISYIASHLPLHCVIMSTAKRSESKKGTYDMPATSKRMEWIAPCLQMSSLVRTLREPIDHERLGFGIDRCVHVRSMDISEYVLSLLYRYDTVLDPQFKVAIGLPDAGVKDSEPQGLHDR